MEIISLVIGFALGVVVVALAIEVGMKKTSKVEPTSKEAKGWNISEISNPRIMAEYLGDDVELPKGSKVIVNQYKDKNMFAGIDVKEHAGVKGNIIIGDDRVLILAGPIKKDEVGFWTVEKEIVEKLNSDFKNLWDEATSMEPEEKK
jgi:hypothetical protein